LRDNYVHYAGAIWLAGKRVTLGASPTLLDLPIAGRYRVETAVPVRINGVLFRDGQAVHIRDQITLEGPAGTDLILIWDTGIAPTRENLPENDLYSGLWQLSI
jgi:hypothetical protein